MSTLQLQTQRQSIDPGTAILRALVPILVAIAVALVMRHIVGRYAGEYPNRVMMDMSVAIVLAVSLNIVNGYTGQFSIGHAAFLAIGGYSAACLSYYTSIWYFGDTVARPGIFGLHEWIFVGSCLFGGLVAAIAGWVVGLPSLRLKGDYLAIVTLGFGEIVRVLLQQTNQQIYADQIKEPDFAVKTSMILPPPVGGAMGFNDVPKLANLFWMYLFVSVAILFAYRLKQSSYGRALLSIREDEIAAEAMGVNVTKLKVRAFVFAAFFAGIAGAMYAHQPGTIILPKDAGFMRSFDVVIMVVLGGLGSISGATLAAILITFGNEWLREPTHVWHVGLGLIAAKVTFDVFFSRNKWAGGLTIACIVAGAELIRYLAIKLGLNLGEFRMIIYALLLISVMILRPRGLFGTREIWDIFRSSRRVRTAAPAPRGVDVAP
jgi:branched-chain amino acid transport system permease protein